MSDNIHDVLRARIEARKAREASDKAKANLATRNRIEPLAAQAFELLKQTDYPDTGPFSSTAYFCFITEKSENDTAAWLLTGESDSGYGYSTHAYLTADGRLVYFDNKPGSGISKIGSALHMSMLRPYMDYLNDTSDNGPSSSSKDQLAKLVVQRLEEFIQKLTVLKNSQ